MNVADIEKLLGMMGARKFKPSGEWLNTNCVLARWTHSRGMDVHPSFGVHLPSGVAKCFTCGIRFGLVRLVKEYSRLAVKDEILDEEQAKELVDFARVLKDDVEQVSVQDGRLKIYEPVVPEHVLSCLYRYHPYLENRGVNESLAKLWGLGFWRGYEGGIEVERVLFPVFSADGDVVGVIGRAVKNETPKYRSMVEGFAKSRYLYGEDRVGDARVIVVVEGPFDVIRVDEKLRTLEMNDVAVVGLMGSEASEEQVRKLLGFADEVVLMLDNDDAGRVHTMRIADAIGNRIPMSIVEYQEGFDDPGEDPDAAVEMIKGRKFYIEKRLEGLLRGGRWL